MATRKSAAPKAAKKVTEPVPTITVSFPVTGKPFTSFKDVIEAYHKLPGYADKFLEGKSPLSDLDAGEKVGVLTFLHRLSTWDGKTAIQETFNKVVASLGKLEV